MNFYLPQSHRTKIVHADCTRKYFLLNKNTASASHAHLQHASRFYAMSRARHILEFGREVWYQFPPRNEVRVLTEMTTYFIVMVTLGSAVRNFHLDSIFKPRSIQEFG